MPAAIPNQDLMTTKTCKACGETKPVNEFYPQYAANASGKGPYTWNVCKACDSIRHKKRYRATWTPERRAALNARQRVHRARLTPEQRLALLVYTRESNARLKEKVFEAYGGFRCACCGEQERAFLTIDHVNNDGAEWRRTVAKALGYTGARPQQYAGAQTYRWLAKHGFPPGFQVLCMNCNFGKRMNAGVCPHQQVRRNDHPVKGVGTSVPKRLALVSEGRG